LFENGLLVQAIAKRVCPYGPALQLMDLPVFVVAQEVSVEYLGGLHAALRKDVKPDCPQCGAPTRFGTLFYNLLFGKTDI